MADLGGISVRSLLVKRFEREFSTQDAWTSNTKSISKPNCHDHAQDPAMLSRKLKKDSVPTVAYSDSLYDADGNGTLPYYLATAFEQIYVQQSGLVPFAGTSTCTLSKLWQPSGIAYFSCPRPRCMVNAVCPNCLVCLNAGAEQAQM